MRPDSSRIATLMLVTAALLGTAIATAQPLAASPSDPPGVAEEGPLSSKVPKRTTPLSVTLSTSGPIMLGEEFRLSVTLLPRASMGTVTGTVTASPALLAEEMSFSTDLVEGVETVLTYDVRAVAPEVFELAVDVQSETGETASDGLWIDFRELYGVVMRSPPLSSLLPTATPPPGNNTEDGASTMTDGTITFNVYIKTDNWYYKYPEAAYDDVTVPYVYIELWDREGCCSGDYLMRTGYADVSGYISWSFDNYDGPFTGGLDPYIKIFSNARPTGLASDRGTVSHPSTGARYTFTSSWGDNLADGTYSRTTKPGTENEAAGFNILARVMQGHIKGAEGGYFTPEAITVRWNNGYNPALGTHYDPATGQIHLGGTTGDPDQWDMDVILHEYGHHFQYKAYGSNMPPYTASPDGLNCAEKNYAWIEGFASFFQAAAQNSPNYQDAMQTDWLENINLEALQANEGDCTYGGVAGAGGYEYSVAGTLFDIFDAANDDDLGWAGYDSLNDGVDEIWDTLRDYRTGGEGAGNIDQFHDGWHAHPHDNEALMHEIYREHRQL